MWGLDPLLLGRILCNCDYPPICGSPSQGVGLDYITSFSSHPSHYTLFCVSLVVVNLFSSLQVTLIDSCSVNSCNFDMPFKGGEPGVFLLCHLGHTFLNMFSSHVFFCSLGILTICTLMLNVVSYFSESPFIFILVFSLFRLA